MSLNPSKDVFAVLTARVFNWISSKQEPTKQRPTKQENQSFSASGVHSNSASVVHSKVEKIAKPAWWAWSTILSLDAPLVAVLWQLLLANSFDFSLKPLHTFLLFVTVWLIYVADRCFDSLAIAEAFTSRHRFYKENLQSFIVLIGAVLCLAVFCAVVWLEPIIFLHGIMLSGIVILYLANIHLPKKPFLLIPKELQIALVFAAGATITFWSQLNLFEQSIQFLFTTLCFAALCFLNCSFISLWEKSVDVLHQQPSLARSTVNTQNLAILLQVAVVALILTTLFLPIDFSLKLALIFSSFGLWVLQLSQTKTSVDLRRVLADVVLMSPLVILLFQ